MQSDGEMIVLWSHELENTEAVVQRCFVKKLVLKISQNSQGNTCANLIFNKVAEIILQLYQKETLAQLFPCEYCEIFKNTFF